MKDFLVSEEGWRKNQGVVQLYLRGGGACGSLCCVHKVGWGGGKRRCWKGACGKACVQQTVLHGRWLLAQCGIS